MGERAGGKPAGLGARGTATRMTDHAPTSPPIAPRRGRWLRRVLVGLGVLLAVLATAVTVVVRALDQPWVKGPIQKRVRDAAGVDLDYRATHLSATGLRLEGLVVLSPVAFRPLAPELARVGELEVRWTFASLTGGDGPLLTSVALRRVAVSLVSDEKRGTSLDALSQPDPGPPPPATPLSRQASAVFGKAPPVEHVVLEDVAITLIQAADGRLKERVSLDGLGARLAFERERSGGWWLGAGLGTATAPLALGLEREGHGKARLRLALDASATSSQVQATVDLAVTEQTLVQDVAVERLLRLDASGRFDPEAGQTELTVARLDAADGTLSAQATLLLPDQGAPLLREARGEVDLAQALRHVPGDLVPLQLAGGSLSFQIRQLLLAGVPSLSQGGGVRAEGAVRGLRVPRADGAVEVSAAKLSLQAQPAEGAGLRGRAEISVERLGLASGEQRIDAEEIEVKIDGATAPDGSWKGRGHAEVALGKLQVASGKKRVDASTVSVLADAAAAPDGTWDGKVDLRLGQLASGLGATLSAAGASLGVRAQGLALDPAEPLAARGKVELTGKASALTVEQGPWRARASDFGLEAHTRLVGGAPFAVEVDLPVGKLEVTGAKGRSYVSAPLRLELGVRDAFPDLERPVRSRAAAQLGLELGAVRATIDLTKQVDSADYTLSVSASSLAAAKALVGDATSFQLPWERMAVDLRSTGRVEQLSSKALTLAQRAELKIEKPGLTLSRGTGAAERVELTLKSRGGTTRHDADLDLAVRGLVLAEKPYGDRRLSLTAAVDAEAPTLRLELDAGGEAGPSAGAKISASFDRGAKALTYDVSTHVERLAPLARLVQGRGAVEGLDLEHLEAAVAARGVLTGVVEAISKDGTVKIVERPLATLGGESRFDVQAKGLAWTGGDQEVNAPSVQLSGELDSKGGRHAVRGELKVESAHLAFGRHEIDLAGLGDRFEVVGRDLAAGEIELTQRLKMRVLRQTSAPDYPVGELSLAVQATRDPDGTIRASLVRIDNPAAGTTLKLDGTVELGGDRRALSLRGELAQDLAKAWSDRDALEGRGNLTLQVRVDSTDLRVFHAEGEVRFAGANLRLAKAGWAVESLDAEIPAQVDFVAGASGLKLRTQSDTTAFSQLRFADQHPYQSRRSFLSIGRLTTPAGVIAPLAGNLQVSKGAILLSQLELGVSKGLVTGQCALLYQGKDPTIVARVRASGVESSYGEPFDGNLAVSISTKERRVDGRAEILRIGRRHLLDLLDIQDPYRADGSLNRIRSALALGYPEHVRMTFKQGFATLGVTFGGAARVVQLDEVRGIPVGPLLDKTLSGMSKKEGP